MTVYLKYFIGLFQYFVSWICFICLQNSPRMNKHIIEYIIGSEHARMVNEVIVKTFRDFIGICNGYVICNYY